jgi:plasmid stability protein
MALIYVRDVPDDLHKAVRIAAIRSDQTMQAFVLEALRHELERRAAGSATPTQEETDSE